MSQHDDLTTGRISYAGLTDTQRAALLVSVMGEGMPVTDAATLVQSDDPVSDAHLLALGVFARFTLGLSTQDDDMVVYRVVKRGRTPGHLDGWIAGLNGSACNLDPDTVVYVRDANGDEVTVKNGDGESVDLTSVRGDSADTGGVVVRLSDGRTVTLEDGRKVPTVADFDGDVDVWHTMREFSRDGGETWESIKWTPTFPRKRK